MTRVLYIACAVAGLNPTEADMVVWGLKFAWAKLPLHRGKVKHDPS